MCPYNLRKKLVMIHNFSKKVICSLLYQLEIFYAHAPARSACAHIANSFFRIKNQTSGTLDICLPFDAWDWECKITFKSSSSEQPQNFFQTKNKARTLEQERQKWHASIILLCGIGLNQTICLAIDILWSEQSSYEEFIRNP